MFVVWFDCCAVAILLILLGCLYGDHQIPNSRNRLFAALVWLTLFSVCCDLLIGLWQNATHARTAPVFFVLINLVGNLYHLVRIVLALLYAMYIAAALNIIEKSRLQRALLFGPFAVALLIGFFGQINGLIFSIDSAGRFHPGGLMPLLYLIALYYLFAALYLNVYFRKVVALRQRLVFHSFALFAMGGVLLQALFPHFMVEGFGTALCLLVIYLTIQRSENVVDRFGLYNREAFSRMLSIRMGQKGTFYLLVGAIPDFHFLEQSLGARICRELTAQLASYLRGLSKHAAACRLSEQLYCLLLPGAEPDRPEALLDRMRARSRQPWNVAGQKLLLPAYFTQLQCPRDAASAEQVFRLLDALEPANRRDGMTDIAAIPPGMTKQRAQEVERALGDALDHQRLVVVYQPIYSVEENRFLSAEALLRLQDETLGAVGPEEFIPVAETCGLIVRVGQFVLDAVCRFLAENELGRYGLRYIEINVSVAECLQDNMADAVLTTLERHGLDARRINLEITETARDMLPETVLRNLNRLAVNGIRFSLDDYGAGYSNIGRILTMPLDFIKLDKSIVQAGFPGRMEQADIVLAETIRMLHKLHKQVIAEGVETKEQADKMKRMGCEFMQGYYYARPMSASAFLRFLSEQANAAAPPVLHTEQTGSLV